MKAIKNFNKLSFILFLFMFLILSYGCSVNPSASDMVGNISDIKNHPFTVSLEVQGDESDGLLEDTLIQTLDFHSAIEISIQQSELFTKIVKENADYCLKVDADIQAPPGGWIYTVNIGGVWNLSNCATKHVVMDEFIRTSSTKTMGVAFNGFTRIRLALGEAARKFIEAGLSQITQLDL